MSRRDDIDSVIRRVRWRSFAIAGVAAAVAFAFGWQTGVSLTIAAVVVIFSFLVLEKLTAHLIPHQERPRLRTLAPLLLVTAGSLVLLTIVLWRWRGFDPVAGAAGLSVVVAAVVPELWAGSEGRKET
jgi:drug/metabolite transporter (DMT)-like permease